MSVTALHSILYRRLIAILAIEPTEPFTEETARSAITNFCEGAVCCRWPSVDGKVRTFEAVFQEVFGKKLDRSVVKKRGAA